MSKSAEDRLLQNAWKHADYLEVGMVWALLAAVLLVAYTIAARADPPKGVPIDPQVHAWFESLQVPAGPKQGWGCCSAADCRTVAYRTQRGTFQAFIKKGTDRDTDAFPDGDNKWHDVPEEHVLHGTPNLIGEAVACWYHDQVLCFVLATLT